MMTLLPLASLSGSLWVDNAPLYDLCQATSDLASVRRVMSKGASTEVRHTLKSQLAEDEV